MLYKAAVQWLTRTWLTKAKRRNIITEIVLVAIAKINAGLQSQILLGMIHANERDATAWIQEWNAIPQMLIHTGTALNHALTIAAKMKVNSEQMRNNVGRFLKDE